MAITDTKKCRRSRPEVFLRKGVLRICSKFTGEHPCRSVISIKLLSTSGWLLLEMLFCSMHINRC